MLKSNLKLLLYATKKGALYVLYGALFDDIVCCFKREPTVFSVLVREGQRYFVKLRGGNK